MISLGGFVEVHFGIPHLFEFASSDARYSWEGGHAKGAGHVKGKYLSPCSIIFGPTFGLLPLWRDNLH